MPIKDSRPVADSGIDPGTTRVADLVVRNARIHTGDPRRPSASSVAITNGIFTAVGDDQTVAADIGPATRVIDALGRRIIPGLNDSHMHVIRGGLNYLLELRWDGVRSLRAALAMLAQQVERTPPGQWVRVVGGWSADQFAEKRLPTVAELNAVAPDTPVLMLHLYQSALMNRAALDALGYNKRTPNPPGAQIVHDHAGNPTGVVLAAPSPMVLYAILEAAPILSPEQQVVSTRYFLRELNRFGITSAIDAAGGFQSFPENYAAVMDLADRGELTVRLAYHLLPQTAGQELDDLRRWVATVTPGQGDSWLRANGAGEALILSAVDFENFSEPRPVMTDQAIADFESAVRLLIDHNWGFRIHATYDETLAQFLDVFDKIAGEGSPFDVRWFFDHAETATPETLERIKGHGGAMSVQNRMMFQGRTFAERYGTERAMTAPPIRRMHDMGLLVAAGTDATRASSYNPWYSLAWLGSGRTMGGVRLFGPENLVNRETALDMYTKAGAALSGESDVKGTIKEGHYGDLAVLSADYFSVADEDISRIESVLTIAGGNIVYAVADYQGIAPDLPAVDPSWSPVSRFGGFPGDPSGLGQARTIVDAARDADNQRVWREQRGELPPASEVPDLAVINLLDGCA